MHASIHSRSKCSRARVAPAVLALAASISPVAMAGAPTNDSCEFAEPLEIGTTVSGTTAGAARDDVPMCDVGGVAPGVWYSILGDGSKFSLEICPSFGQPTVSIYCSGCDRLGCIGSETWSTGDYCPGVSLNWCTEPGVEYLILVQAYHSSNSGAFDFTITSDLASCPQGAPCLEPPPPPPNDECAQVLAIEGEGEYPYTLDGSTSAPGYGFCGQPSVAIQKDVWFAWTSSRTDTVSLSICGSASAPVTVSIYEGCECAEGLTYSECLLLDPVVCGRNFLNLAQQTTFSAREGQCYLLQVGVAHRVGGGAGTLRITYDEPADQPCTISTNRNTNPCTTRGGWDAIRSTRPNEIVADNFKVLTDELLRGFCFWGSYFNGTISDCRLPFSDEFEVVYYADDCGKPGAVIGGPFEQSTGTLTVNGPVFTGRQLEGELPEYAYSVEHAAVALTGSTEYWVSVSNSAAVDCAWYWERGSTTRGHAYVDGLRGDGPDGFARDEVITGDLSYCMAVNLAEPDAGCSDPPENDQCSNAMLTDDSVLRFITVGATTDGLGRDVSEPVALASCDFSLGDETVNNDVWFVYEATCSGNLQLGTCDSDFDTKIIAYPEMTCPPAYNEAVACNDDACGSSDLALQSQVDVSVREGERYLIRVGGYRGATGVGTLTLDFVPPSSGKLFDYATLARCFTGSCSTDACEPPIYSGTCCGSADFDRDGDVDLEDYEQLRAVLVGP